MDKDTICYFDHDVLIRGATAPKIQERLKWLLPDGSTGGLVVSKASLNLNFSFLNWILLLLISSSYPVVLTRLGGPCSRPYTSTKISMVEPGIKPRTSWMAVRCVNHYTKQTVSHFIIWWDFMIFCCLQEGPGSSSGKVLDYKLDGPGSILGVGGVEIFFTPLSRLALESTNPPIKYKDSWA